MVKKRAHPPSCVQGAIVKDKYMETIEQAEFQEVEIIEGPQYSFEDVVSDPDAKVTVFNSERNAEELSVSELDEEAKEIVKEALTATESINVLAVKPSR